ncbi:flagellar basal body L-ring protein FlgH [Desulfuromonas sp. KJ2020]|uniref:flagellar basal body L-ring protein FlgH n=1 Tax=Desulfuromonas sp. KJ2020 TaxID=2919173 RepID=UPI0020A7BD1E|nr:flagellar basal body L-ring protein FlgH [Desulfuromonas sp. KJ2020]MCP3178417.1 flagellar basal body L-ring protein FlgH [Desulfuromonas sp. KJ2020]
MKKAITLFCAFGLFAAGCASHQPAMDPPPPLTPTAAMVEPPVEPSAPGSLWNAGNNDLFADHKARRVGDILTVAIFERASASKEAKTSTGRSSSASAGIDNLFGIEKNIGMINSAINPASLIGTEYENSFQGSGTTSRKEDLVATLTVRVTEVFGNGNMRIEGGKNVRVNNEDQIIRLTGLVRPADVTRDNIVDSKYILDSQITYTGKGVISDKQKQGWLVRVLDNVWPF